MSASTHRRTGGKSRVAAAAAMAVVLVAMAAALVVARPARSIVDRPTAGTSAVGEQVSAMQLNSYCPAQMALPDAGEYGDAEFRASAGDIASTARYAAFGSVFQLSVASLDPDADQGDDLAATMEEGAASVSLAGAVGSDSHVLDVRLLESTTGTGSASSMASWATTGDLKGIQAASCIAPSLSHAFLVSDTRTGTTQQLVVANPSSKPTSIEVDVWGSASGARMESATGGTLTVAAHGEATMDLSAATVDQEGLYVTVDSQQTPVSAFVRAVRMDGLTSKGSDFVVPLAQATATSIIPSVSSGDAVRLLAHAAQDTSATLSWVTEQGLRRIKTIDLEAGRVSSMDLGKAPADAMALCVAGEGPVDAMLEVTRAGEDGQADFTSMNAAASAEASAIALPDGAEGELTFANLDNGDVKATLKAYGPDGERRSEREVTLPANASARIAVSDLGDDIASVTLDDPDRKVAWSARLTRRDLDKAGVSGVAHVDASPLTPRSERIWSSRDPSIVR